MHLHSWYPHAVGHLQKESFNISRTGLRHPRTPCKQIIQMTITRVWIIYTECESYIQKQPPEVFYEKGAFWHIVKFVGKHPCQSLFLNKVASWGLQFFLKIGSSIGVLLWISRIYRCFPGTSVFLYNTSGPLLRHGCPQWRTLRSEIIFSNWKSFQNDDEKLFRFSSYSSFCLDFLVMYQNGLIKKIRLISNFTRSQPD